MKQILIKKGIPEIFDVPSPSIEAGHIIVQSSFSCISIGTEIQGMKLNSVPLWKRAINDPKKAVDFIKKSSSNGISLIAFANGIKSNEWPIALWDLLQSSEISFKIEQLLSKKNS